MSVTVPGLHRARTVPWLALACVTLALAHCALFLDFANLPILDLPNHAARALVLADLAFHGGARFGALYTLQPGIAPYIGADLPLVALMTALPPLAAARAYLALVFLALPASVWLFARGLGLAPAAAWLAALAALVVAADITFIEGFAAFRLGLAVLFVALWVALPFAARGGGPRFAAYATLVIAGYTIHLATPVLLAGALGGLLVLPWPWTRGHVLRSAALLAVPVLVVGLHLALQPVPAIAAAPYVWPTFGQKVEVARGYFLLFDPRSDDLRRLAFVVAIALPLLRLRAAAFDPRAAQLTAAAVVAGLTYIALPSSQGEIFDIDWRALPVLVMMVALAPLAGVDSGWLRQAWAGRLAVLLAIAVPAANLAYLAHHLRRADANQGDVRAVLRELPRGARVLSIVVENNLSSMLLHTGAFSLLDRDGYYPYLFAGDQGYPQSYFRYRDRPYAPPQFWYERGLAVDWRTVRREWPYLLVLGPFERAAIPLGTRTLATRRNATLLAVEPTEGTLNR